MVAISKSISTKIKDRQGDITDDEVCASAYLCAYKCVKLLISYGADLSFSMLRKYCLKKCVSSVI